MPTKFLTMETLGTPDVKTTFNRIINANGRIEKYEGLPTFFDNVIFLWSDKEYGDVFVAWDDSELNNRSIFFGKKGSEFSK